MMWNRVECFCKIKIHSIHIISHVQCFWPFVQDCQRLSDTRTTFDETRLAFCEELVFNNMMHDTVPVRLCPGGFGTVGFCLVRCVPGFHGLQSYNWEAVEKQYIGWSTLSVRMNLLCYSLLMPKALANTAVPKVYTPPRLQGRPDSI